jgi:hypothetical protein
VCIALIRTTVATLIAFAVAFLPVSGNSIPLPSLSSPPPEVTMADHADLPCCALKCAALASAVLPATGVAPLYIAEGSPRAVAEDALHTHVIAPTHPPPI